MVFGSKEDRAPIIKKLEESFNPDVNTVRADIVSPDYFDRGEKKAAVRSCKNAIKHSLLESSRDLLVVHDEPIGYNSYMDACESVLECKFLGIEVKGSSIVGSDRFAAALSIQSQDDPMFNQLISRLS